MDFFIYILGYGLILSAFITDAHGWKSREGEGVPKVEGMLFCSKSQRGALFWVMLKFKDAGFVYESFRNEMNQVILDFCFHETNPRNKSFKNESTKQIFQKWIHETNLSKKVYKMKPRNESTKRIFWNQYRESEALDLYGFGLV